MTTAAKIAEKHDLLDVGQFELHSVNGESMGGSDSPASPWADAAPPASRAEVSIASDDGIVWVRVNVAREALTRTPSRGEAVAGFRVVRRRLGAALAMLSQAEEVLVNGVPALPLAVLCVKDSIVLAPGKHYYVTQRLKAHVGSPPQHVLNKPCPFCQIPITEDTRIYLCLCGAPFHFETDESHPHEEESERLNCFSKIEKCLSCGRKLTLEEFLEWDPAE